MSVDVSKILQELEFYKAECNRLKTEHAEAYRQLEQLVLTDALTGIGNRRFFDDRLQHAIYDAERGRDISLIIIDVDNFKKFNDTYGHQAGDTALIQVATAMNQIIRKVDYLARYGGDEFAVISFVNSDGSTVLAAKLRAAVEAVTNQYRMLTVSIGVATYTNGDTAQSLINHADQALYMSKAGGRNRVTTKTMKPLKLETDK